MTNKNNTVLYIGVTSNLHSRVQEHKTKMYSKSFTARYNCDKLIYYQFLESIEEAIILEKKLKNKKRAWKYELINKFNPDWRDLTKEVENMV